MSAAGHPLEAIPAMPPGGALPYAEAPGHSREPEEKGADGVEGIEAELVQTLNRRRAQLVRIAQRMTRCQVDAEDIVQESVLKALNNLSHFRGDSRMDTWLHAIVVNTARSWLRCQRKHGELPLEPGWPEDGEVHAMDFPHPGESPEDRCRQQELRRLLLGEIGNLNPVLREPIELCDLGERSYREAAGALNLTDATIKARLFRGRMQLRRRLARHVRARRAGGSREGSATHGMGRGRVPA